MKSHSLFPTLIAATLFLLPRARGEDTATGPQISEASTSTAVASTGRKQRDIEMLKKYDKNRDGKIDEEERSAAKADMLKNGSAGRGNALRERIVKRFDKDGDGVLNEQELTAAIASFKNNPRFIQRFDKNGDGKLDEAELVEARQQIGQRASTAREAKKAK